MKIIRDEVCYVETEDLVRVPLPSFIKLPTELDMKEFIKFVNSNEIEYFKSRQDIVDYDSICLLSMEDLTTLIKETYEKLIKLETKWLESSTIGRTKLNKDKEYQNSLMTFKAIYESLSSYKSNKRQIDISIKYIALIQAYKNNPRVELSPNGEFLPNNFDAEYIANNFIADGFIETSCLDDEEKASLTRLRNLK